MMKLFAHYDPTGTIRSLVSVDAPEGVSLMLSPRPGEFVAEVQDHKLDRKMPSYEELRELARNHIIATPVPSATLAKKH